jgi:AAA domain
MNTKATTSTVAAKAEKFPLRFKFAHELSKVFTPPDELVQELLIVGNGSVLCGPTNTGKTNIAIDIGAAVARGTEWMGRKTEAGMVIYLASESPASVEGRLQAYQQYHGVLVPNFVVVQNPINLFKDDVGTEAIIKTVRMLEKQHGKKVKLIIGDTLARLSAGANENAAQDMGLVIERFDRIRNECAAHFMLIHHTGKNVSAGMRGSSALPAAVDTTIEIVQHPAGSYAEVTKERDLGSKGSRIGFKFAVVEMGKTKWGAVATACVVMPASAPEKAKSKRRSEVEGAIVEFLSGKDGVTKAQVVKHFDERHAKGPIYRAIKNLCEDTTLQEADGLITLADSPKGNVR